MTTVTTSDPNAGPSLSLDGLDLSDMATVGPCGHELPLKVAIVAATTTSTGAAMEDSKAKRSDSTKSKKHAAMMTTARIGVCPMCAAAAAAAAAAASVVDRHHGSRQQTPATAAAAATTIIQSVTDGLASKGRPHVTFKYKNCLYSLGIVTVGHEQQATAQGRIAHVLTLTSLKILSRGKVVYPTKTMTEEQVSQRLLEISRSDRNTTSSITGNHPTNKVSLLVMGTVAGQELSAAPMTASNRNASKNDQGYDVKSSVAWWWNFAISWTGYVAQQSVRMAHGMLVTALAMIQSGCSAARDLFYLTTASGAPPPRPSPPSSSPPAPPQPPSSSTRAPRP